MHPILRLDNLQQQRLSGSFLGAVVVVPPNERRQRHENRLGAALRLQPELGASVVEEVELDIPATSEELPLSLFFAHRLSFTSLYERFVERGEEEAQSTDELKQLLLGLLGGVLGEVIEKDPANPSGLISVGKKEVLVAFALERIVTVAVFLTERFQLLVEADNLLLGGFALNVIRR